jgi:hypothetical protein
MGKRNFDRPRFKTAGKRVESVSGGDIPPEFRTTPQLRLPKAEARRQAEKALRDFMAKTGAKQVSIIPDDDDPPF